MLSKFDQKRIQNVGLSSPGRLHDLFVNLEAMSPGEYKTGGMGLQIAYGVHETPFGRALLATTKRGICNLHFLDLDSQPDPQQIIRESWSNAEIYYEPQMTQALCDRIFNSVNLDRQKPLTLLVKGTNFQIQVWRALLNIPFGKLATYKTLAEAIARPTATRAIGNAVGKNPIAYLIPCHRVIRASGELGGYRWGIERKSALLGWEASHSNSLEKQKK